MKEGSDMTNPLIQRPDSTEYQPYFSRYIVLVPEGDILALLTTQNESTMALLRSLPESSGAFRYAPEKWSIKELVAHLSDAERIFADRALRFARNDETPLPGFEENDYVRAGGFGGYPLADLTAGFENVRRSTVSLFKLMSSEASKRRGKANGAEISVRALAYVIVGHEIHHVNVLRTRYLEGVQAS
jgi:hypothetical protein